MNFSAFLHKYIADLIEERRIVVWYDGEGNFAEFVSKFKVPNGEVLSAGDSVLKTRREADEIYRLMNESENVKEARRNLLIYVPRARAVREEEKREDPFEVYALAGAAFGDTEDQKLESLARRAMPDRADEITRLFREGKPTITLLDGFEETQRYPLLHQVLKTESASEVIALVLCDADKAKAVESAAGCKEEVLRLLDSSIGFKLPADIKDWHTIRNKLAAFVLFTEFVLDLPSEVPDSLSAVPRADEAAKETAYAACNRMRSDAGLREIYLEIAERVEGDLRLAELTESVADLGNKDTFPFEERRRLRRIVKSAEGEALLEAFALLEHGRKSVWKDRPDRLLLWTAVERCLGFLKRAEETQTALGAEPLDLRALVTSYSAEGGWAEQDRGQRLFEQSTACCQDDGEIAPLLDFCRRKYREISRAIQERFLVSVEAEGWPPEGVLRQTQVFDKFVAPLLEEREKVAYFLVDSLRFEMGRDLCEALERFGEAEVFPAAAVLPATTACGMAALMPKADGMLRLVETESGLVTALSTRLLKGSSDRVKYLKELYGDRFLDLKLDDLLSKFKRYKAKIEGADLLLVRTQDPDLIGESLGGRLARKYLSDVIGDLNMVVRRLIEADYSRFVIASDHGHVLIHEIPPGDVVSEPTGEWVERKRRCRLGKAISTGEGCVILKAAHVGIQGDVEDICVPVGLKVFSKGESYFHEGISLPEVVVPVVTFKAEGVAAGQGKQKVEIRYRSDKFTSRVIGLKLLYTTPELYTESVRVKVEAFDGTSAKSNIVGEAADCDARDESTREVILKAGEEAQVPVLLDPDFSGPEVEIRVLDPQSRVVWSKLSLSNAGLD